MVYGFGQQIYAQQNPQPVNPATLPRQQQFDFFKNIYTLGRNYIANNPNEYGDIDSRPTDRRENYVKRCVGLPGQPLQIKDRIIYINGKPNKEPEEVQYTYRRQLAPEVSTFDIIDKYDALLKELGISQEDLMALNQTGVMPLTKRAVARLLKEKAIIKSIKINTEATVGDIHPLNP